MNDKQRRFVAEYIIDLNATQAAIRAGYSKKTAYAQGFRLLRDAEIQASVAKEQEKRSERTEITQDRVLRELGRLGFANMLDYIRIGADGRASVDLKALSRDQAAAISEVTVEQFTEGRGKDARQVTRTKFKLCDKKGPLELIGRHLAMFTDNHVIRSVNHEDALDQLDEQQPAASPA